MGDVTIVLSDQGVRSVTTLVCAEEQFDALEFIQSITPAIQKLDRAARKSGDGKKE